MKLKHLQEAQYQNQGTYIVDVKDGMGQHESIGPLSHQQAKELQSRIYREVYPTKHLRGVIKASVSIHEVEMPNVDEVIAELRGYIEDDGVYDDMGLQWDEETKTFHEV